MKRYVDQLKSKVVKMLCPHQKGHSIMYNHYFIETIQKACKEHAKKNQTQQLNVFFKIKPEMSFSYVSSHQGFHTEKLLKALNQQTEANMNCYTCSHTLASFDYLLMTDRPNLKAVNVVLSKPFTKPFVDLFYQPIQSFVVDVLTIPQVKAATVVISEECPFQCTLEFSLLLHLYIIICRLQIWLRVNDNK